VNGFIKVCDLQELPPGKGKRVQAFGQDIVLYNREGRILATIDEPTTATRAPYLGPAVCRHPGSRFDTEQEDSYARSHAHSRGLRVRIMDDGVYLAVDEGGRPEEATGIST
jgi:hypothetical protein